MAQRMQFYTGCSFFFKIAKAPTLRLEVLGGRTEVLLSLLPPTRWHAGIVETALTRLKALIPTSPERLHLPLQPARPNSRTKPYTAPNVCNV